MITLIIGGSGSGKSVYAENYVLKEAKDQPKVYLATMQIYDEEGKEKVRKHQIQREGKHFRTIEKGRNIGSLGEQLHKDDTVLLECMSNLVANEMFQELIPLSCKEVVDHVVCDVIQVNAKIKHLVIVSNNVFEDGVHYDETTMEYIKALGMINQKIVDMADQVIEVIVGIPVKIK